MYIYLFEVNVTNQKEIKEEEETQEKFAKFSTQVLMYF